MKAFVACALLAVASASVDHPKWASYKAAHNKEYDLDEEHVRAAHFVASHDHIESHNAAFARGEVNYSLGHNHLSDMSQQEVKDKLLGRKSMKVDRNITEFTALNMPGAPASYDWRSYGIITPAKDQAGCGSCYSFGTMGVIESAIARKTGQMLDLSEQQIVDCTYRTQGSMNGGCQGGHELVVMDAVSRNGVEVESSYPYNSGRSGSHGSCRGRTGSYGKGLRYTRVPERNEPAMAEAIATLGPLVIAISGENRDFQLFRGGIFDLRSCPQNVDHLISLVGYGSEGGRNFWIVKNSWGRQWGENGFGKVLRGVNQCGIASDPSYHIYF